MAEQISRFLGWTAVIVILFYGSTKGSLLPSDDAIYVRSAQEMLETKAFLEPTWEHHVLFEKGPLLNWEIAAGMAIFGKNDTGARFFITVFALLMAIILYLLGKEWGDGEIAGWLAMLFGVFSHIMFFTIRRPIAEVPAISLGLLGLYLGIKHRYILSGIVLGLVFLIKYPIAILYLIIVGLEDYLENKNLKGWLKATAWAIIVAAPWHIYMSVKYGLGFWKVYVGYHIVDRMSTEIATDMKFNLYIKEILRQDLVLILPWLLGVIYSIVLVIKREKTGIILSIWIILAFLPGAISSTRHIHYFTWTIPALSIASAVAWSKLSPRRSLNYLMVFALAFAAISVNRIEILNPDFGHASKAVCRELKAKGLVNKIAGMFEIYDPDLVWYCNRDIPIYGRDRTFLKTMKGIPMLRSVVYELNKNIELKRKFLISSYYRIENLKDLHACCAILDPNLKEAYTNSPYVVCGFEKNTCNMLKRKIVEPNFGGNKWTL